MAKQRVFEVAQQDARWVVPDNIGLYATRHRTRHEAISAGKRIAEMSQPGRVIVRAANNSLSYDVTLGGAGPLSGGSALISNGID